jgi:hypothetical protein
MSHHQAHHADAFQFRKMMAAEETGGRRRVRKNGLGSSCHKGDEFKYSRLNLRDLTPAQAWTPERPSISGALANQVIVEAYASLDRQLDAYLCAPEVSSWLSFAKYSAREVGSWIRGLEEAWSLLHALRSPRSSLSARLRDAQALFRLLRAGGAAGSALRTALRFLRGEAAPLGGPGALRGGGVKAFLRRIAAAARALCNSLVTVRDALVEGNTELYGRVAFAFDVFMAAEARGASGLAALAAEIQAGRLDDSSGYLLQGFAKYRLARELGLARALSISEAARAALDVARRKLIFDANLLIAIQEQALVLQRATVFGHPAVRALLGAVRPGDLSLLVGDGRNGLTHRFSMLPDGGNWADFAARMGFRRALPEERESRGVFTVVLPGGSAEGERLVPDATQRGTILDLFTRYFDGPLSHLLRSGDPRDLAQA